MKSFILRDYQHDNSRIRPRSGTNTNSGCNSRSITLNPILPGLGLCIGHTRSNSHNHKNASVVNHNTYFRYSFVGLCSIPHSI